MLDLLNHTIELGKKAAGIFRWLKTKIAGDQTAAAEKLQEVIAELLKFFTAVQQEVSGFQNLDLLTDTKRAEAKKALNDIRSGEMKVRISVARGSCHKIALIYDNDLSPWFDGFLAGDPARQSDIRSLFANLTQLDANMIQATVHLEEYLSNKAEAILSSLREDKPQEAAAFHEDASEELANTRRGLSETVTQLVDANNDFRQAAKII